IPRIPIIGSNVNKHVEWAKNWLRQLKATKPHVLDRYLTKKSYTDGDVLVIGKHKFNLSIQKVTRQSGSIRYDKNGQLNINIPDIDGYDEQKLIQSLIIRFAQNYFLPFIIDKVNYYNHRYFKKSIEKVRLKYNKTNW